MGCLPACLAGDGWVTFLPGEEGAGVDYLLTCPGGRQEGRVTYLARVRQVTYPLPTWLGGGVDYSS